MHLWITVTLFLLVAASWRYGVDSRDGLGSQPVRTGRSQRSRALTRPTHGRSPGPDPHPGRRRRRGSPGPPLRPASDSRRRAAGVGFRQERHASPTMATARVGPPCAPCNFSGNPTKVNRVFTILSRLARFS